MKRTRRAAACLATLAALACAGRPLEIRPEAPVPAAPPVRAAEAVPEAASRSSCSAIVRIEVSKSARTLRAYCSDGVRVDIPVALGPAPSGPKQLAGDLRTPEGRYRVVAPARASRFHLFVPIDYPSLADAERARSAGTITHEDYDRIRDAHEQGMPPPQDTPLGGHLGLHGEGEDHRGASARRDWTLGCVAMSDPDIRFVAERLTPDAVVEILPE